jgi:hypothetical protein
MLGTGLIFALYPLARSPWLMGLCAALLGVTLGCVQPMIMSTLHRITPDQRHVEHRQGDDHARTVDLGLDRVVPEREREGTGQSAEHTGHVRQPPVVTALGAGIERNEFDDEEVDEPAGERAE